MCGFAGVIGKQNITADLTASLKGLEHPGVDATGLVIPPADAPAALGRYHIRIKDLAEHSPDNIMGHIGIGNTYWVYHERVHPGICLPFVIPDNIAIVLNGIIHNQQTLKKQLRKEGYDFISNSDIEVIARLIQHYLKNEDGYIGAVRKTVHALKGHYAMAFLNPREPGHLILTRNGSTAVIGIGAGKNYIATDSAVLRPMAGELIYLKDGDIAEIRHDSIAIYDADHKITTRSRSRSDAVLETPEDDINTDDALLTLQGRISSKRIIIDAFGETAEKLLPKIKNVQIVASDSAYYTGLVGKYWLNKISDLPCQVETADSFCSRINIVKPNTLFVALSEHCENPVTLASLKLAMNMGYASTLSICSTAGSPIVRCADLSLVTGRLCEGRGQNNCDFISNLVGVFLLSVILGRFTTPDRRKESFLTKKIQHLPEIIKKTLAKSRDIKNTAAFICSKKRLLLVGAESVFPVIAESAKYLKRNGFISIDICPYFLLQQHAVAPLSPNTAVLALIPSVLMNDFHGKMREIGADFRNIVIMTNHDKFKKFPGDFRIITLPESDSDFLPFSAVIALKMLVRFATQQEQPEQVL